ncbi:MAG: hypothetical protein AAFR11_13770 [Pseudomonadota bacterium]
MDDDDHFDIDDDELDALERAAPLLVRVRRYAEGLNRVPWFANLGEPPTPGVRAAAERFARGLGFPDAELSILVDWPDAAAAAEIRDWHDPAWEAEELSRSDLTTRALEAIGEDALQVAMALVAQRAGEAVRSRIEEQAALWDAPEDGAERAAAGAAAQAAHYGALILLASAADPEFDAADHPLAAKLQLFEFGRWPVALVGATINLF